MIYKKKKIQKYKNTKIKEKSGFIATQGTPSPRNPPPRKKSVSNTHTTYDRYINAT